MSTTKTSTIYLILLIFFSAISCVSKKDKLRIDDEIVLKTGSVEITRYEYEKNKKKEVENQTFKSPEEWLKNYIANSYFLADAYKKKYDTISAISKRVNYALITMLGKFKGYLWDKVEEPKLVFSEKEIKEVYGKQNKLFDLEYFLFPNKKLFNATLKNDTCINTKDDFKKLIDECSTTSVKYINAQFLYPFNELEPVKKQIFASKQGDILKISFNNGKILIAYNKKITLISQKEFNKEKENIYSNLKHNKEKQLVDDKQISIFNKANIVINSQVSDLIIKKIKGDLSSDVSNKLLADTVLNFLFNQHIIILKVADFFDYYNYNPFMFEITDRESLNEVLRNYVIEKYLYAESVNLGIINDKKFILDKRDYMNRLILNAYYQKNFYPAKVSDKDIYDYYNTNKKNFSQCKTCYVSVFTFKDMNSAYFNLNLINKIISRDGIKNSSDTSMMGLISYCPNEIFETTNKKYPPALVHNLFISKTNTPIGPLESNNQVNIFVKTKEEGQEIQPFELVKETIEKQIQAENMEILKYKKLKELMNNYSIEINKIQK